MINIKINFSINLPLGYTSLLFVSSHDTYDVDLSEAMLKAGCAYRVFVAQREAYNNTWINIYPPFVDGYAADDTECTAAEVCNFRHLVCYLAMCRQ